VNVPRLGPIEALLLGARFYWDPVRSMDDYHRRLGPIIAVDRLQRDYSLPGTPLVFLVGGDLIKAALTATDIVRPSGLWFVGGPPGSAQKNFQSNYLTKMGPEHASISAAVVPQLKAARVEKHFERLRSIAIDEIGAWPMGTRIDLYAQVRRLAQRVAFALIFGDDDPRMHEFGKRLSAYHNANWSMFAHLAFNSRGFPYHNVLIEAEALQRFMAGWVAERRGAAPGSDLRAAFAAMTDDRGRPLGPGALASYFSFLSFASYETMSSALTWTLFLLADNTEVAADLSDELRPFGRVDEIDRQTLSNLPLLGAVIKESLRLCPPTPYIPMRTVDHWEIAGCRLRRSAQVILNVRLTHLQPEIYPQPEKFLPERWSSIKPSAYEYLPFSAGPRRCPGQHFAIDFMKVALVAILTRYRVAAPSSKKLGYRFAGIMMPRVDIPTVLSPIEANLQ
jgi:cytochrome P450